MLTDCSEHEETEIHVADCHDTGEEAHVAEASSYLNPRMSRAQLLQTLGGGVALVLTAGALRPDAAHAAPRSLAAEPATGPAEAGYLCLIVLDGGRPDYITRNLSALPNLASLLRRSRWYNRAWVGDLMSITPPGHAVIGTGSLPKNDGGIVNWDWGIHSTGKISPTTQAVENYQNGWVFNLMKESGTPTLAGVIRKKYPNDPVIAGSGAHFHAAGPLGGPDASWIFSYQRSSGYWVPFTLGPHPVPSTLLNDGSLRVTLPSSNLVLADAFQQPYSPDVTVQQQSDAEMNVYVDALIARAQHDVALARQGLLPNTVPADEQPVIHWKRRLAVTAAGIGVLGGTGAGLAKAVAAVRRQGTTLSWEE